jgi:hypothetical protein
MSQIASHSEGRCEGAVPKLNYSKNAATQSFDRNLQRMTADTFVRLAPTRQRHPARSPARH